MIGLEELYGVALIFWGSWGRSWTAAE